MIEVKINKKEAEQPYGGQIRYNDTGMYVLVVEEENGRFSTLLLTETNTFHFTSKNVNSQVVMQYFPHVAKGILHIDN